MNKITVVNDRVVLLDDDYDSEAAEARFVRKVTDELLPMAQANLADMKSRKLSPSELSAIIRQSLDALGLMWAGLGPERRREMEKKLAELGWAEARETHRQAVELAKAMVAKQGAN
jgi:hypothetical protein